MSATVIQLHHPNIHMCAVKPHAALTVSTCVHSTRTDCLTQSKQ